jgi:hypothetical protein
VTVAVDDNPDPAAFTPAVIHADLRDGRRVEIQVPHLLGSPVAPLGATARLDKVRQCLTFGGVAVDASRFAGRVEALDELADVAGLLALEIEKLEEIP